MRISDLIRLSFKNLRGGWVVLPAAGYAVAVFCLCFAGAALQTVQEEKNRPYEAIISAEGTENLSDDVAAEIAAIPDVTAATPVLQLPVRISAGVYTAELTLTGINPDYMEGTFLQGGFFPENTAMPYIVLNEAACKQFLNDEGTSDDNTPGIEWLDERFSVQTGEGIKAVTSKVCGILSGDEEAEQEQEPAAYIGLASAKELLRESGQSTAYTAINVRVKNISYADSVSKAITALGLTVPNSTEELPAGWDMALKEMAYLIVTGIFCLLCASVLILAWRKISLMKQRAAYRTLKWIGMREKDIGRLFVVQSAMISLFGIAVGILVSVSLPSFLATELQETSIFTLAIPFWIAVLSAAVCIITGSVPVLISVKDIIEL